MAHSQGKQAYSSIPSQQDYSTLEVDESANLPEVKPVADKTQLPEAVNTTGGEVAPGAAHTNGRPAEGRICGLRRRTFWIGLVLAVAIIIGVAVGAGVGATRKSSGNTASPSSSGATGGIASNSKLASSNYTDASGVQHSQVYYQDNSLRIMMADWDSSANNWTFAQVLPQNNDSAINAKNGTPIAAANYWNSDTGDNTTDFRCLFLDDDNYIRFIWAPNRTGIDGWQVTAQPDRTMQAGANSSLAEYVSGCNNTQGCNSADFTLYESATNDTMLYYPFSNGNGAVTGKLAASGLTPRAGTAFAVAPIPRVKARSVAYPRAAMYLVDSDGLLSEAYGGYDLTWTNNDLGSSRPVSVDSGAQLAAMSQYRLDDYNLQILITKAEGGVKMAYMNGDDWSSINSVESMKNVVALSPIAANQLGRVYAFESGDNGTQLVEWSRVTGTIPSFERVGVVDVV